MIDKPQGMSSHAVVQRVRRACKVRRVGHAGTLDPLATGVLLVGVGQCTRLIEYLMAQDKTYRATMKLGLVTDSQDITGQVQQQHDASAVTRQQIEDVCHQFVGQIEQIPPMFSALKKDGVPLYRLARKGVEIERQKRSISIESLVVEAVEGDEITIVVACSKGTYIRTLCHDIGLELGCGACMTSLRRTRSGAFDETMAITVDQLMAGEFEPLPALDALHGMLQVQLAEQGVSRLRDGIPPRQGDVSNAPTMDALQTVCLMHDNTLMAIAQYDPEHELDERGDYKLLKVFPQGV
ncbi:tRNA pseudouridine(55) synthase TruB [Desulfuromonas acetoxidans]|uniref:tRNA pseudouridine(55) synthase TruB n=1 Tax=Desulfuromonas acetoxidans TaxID=891 RepID=UPI00138A0332|nr:tRNA pseudouridine(55) synthase TruB [Desulfuromonas acetoxidans]MBF0644125.1 tRNA pseudouridine(55) synthase TruB [Desulfuromonas acetoxidans]NVD24577.1 tRNA pseudouridine(55) synthase TruB [Desulfuromonas acetoxidans]NVE16473.1 tRNA pseudouridine(55) synthase TruB [Desulfuromonas acetoxidans]